MAAALPQTISPIHAHSSKPPCNPNHRSQPSPPSPCSDSKPVSSSAHSTETNSLHRINLQESITPSHSHNTTTQSAPQLPKAIMVPNPCAPSIFPQPDLTSIPPNLQIPIPIPLTTVLSAPRPYHLQPPLKCSLHPKHLTTTPSPLLLIKLSAASFHQQPIHNHRSPP
jgi:hypothetical protein